LILVYFSIRAVISRPLRITDFLGWLGILACVAVAFLAEFFMGAETAVRNVLALIVSMALFLLISALFYRSIRMEVFRIETKYTQK
jgi:ribose/xylose/arabinose/galactoside ABC-type transport system permease subunit